MARSQQAVGNGFDELQDRFPFRVREALSELYQCLGGYQNFFQPAVPLAVGESGSMQMSSMSADIWRYQERRIAKANPVM